MVTEAQEVNAALAAAVPGDEIVLADGEWRDLAIRFVANGTAEWPITLRAETPGGVTLTGDSTLSIGGQHLVVEGLVFRDGSPTRLSHIVEFRAGSLEAEDCRVTDCAIIDYNPPDPSTRYFWVGLYGRRNRVDHCLFSGQNHNGVTVVVWLDGEPNDHRIDHNHFKDHASGGGENGWETIRIGTSAFVNSSSRTTVEFNLFEACDGELELISNKSCDNVYRANTIRGCAGMLTLRQGRRCRVEGNIFLGDGVSGSGGIRVIGPDHVVVNNYISGTRGRDGAAITLYAGVPNAGVASYPAADRALVAFNTVVDVTGPHLGYGRGLGSRDRTLLPEDVVVANNLFAATHSTTSPALGEQDPSGISFAGNLVSGLEPGFGQRVGVEQRLVALQVDENGLWRPGEFSANIDAAVGAFPEVAVDFDGVVRTGAKDVGADEFGGGPAVWPLMTAGSTGPSWRVPVSGAGEGRVRNLSTRGFLGAGAEALTAGFVVTRGACRLLIRGVGPALAEFGVPSALADPRLTLTRVADRATLGANDDWRAAADPDALRDVAMEVGAFPLTASGGDAAMLVTLAPGLYSARLTSVADRAGAAMVEVYWLE